MCCIAVPVADAAGRVVAALSVAMPKSRFHERPHRGLDEGARCGGRAHRRALGGPETTERRMIEPSFIFGQFVSGLSTAMYLFLIASGLSLIFGVLRVLNFAHGSFYMLGAYLAWQLVQWLGPRTESFWLAVLGAALRRRAGGRADRAPAAAPHVSPRGAVPAALHLCAGAGASRRGAGTPGARSSSACPRPPSMEGAFRVFGTNVPSTPSSSWSLGPAIALGIWLLLNRTGLGRTVRAAALDREMLVRARRQRRLALHRHVRARLVLRRPRRRAGDAGAQPGAGHGRRDHRRSLHRGGDRRARARCGARSSAR